MKKFISVLMIVVVVVLIFTVYINKNDVYTNKGEARADRIASVLHTAWDGFGLFSFQLGETDPTIWIGMDETKSELELREYLEENIDKSDLSHYNIKVFKKNIQELETEHLLYLQNNDN
ncbi:hypothetical protein [Peribacillus loiseleuriae]|uniref:hypothetical protein n=1 Tax=Peribacillus loiseleuriae TaxID=1679170 RepID=UPI003CFE06DA